MQPLNRSIYSSDSRSRFVAYPGDGFHEWSRMMEGTVCGQFDRVGSEQVNKAFLLVISVLKEVLRFRVLDTTEQI